MESIYTAMEASKLLKIGYRRVLDEITLKRLTAFKVGKQYRILESSLSRYIEDNTIEKGLKATIQWYKANKKQLSDLKNVYVHKK